MSQKQLRTCAHCHCQFVSKTYRHQRYCGTECYRAASHVRPSKNSTEPRTESVEWWDEVNNTIRQLKNAWRGDDE